MFLQYMHDNGTASKNHSGTNLWLTFNLNFLQSLFVLIQKVTKKIKKIRFPAQCHTPSADFQAGARSSIDSALNNKESME